MANSIFRPLDLINSYPDSDLLGLSEEVVAETTWEQLTNDAETAGDTLFLFLCRELGGEEEEVDIDEQCARVERALEDIDAVRCALYDAATPIAKDK